MMKLNVIGVGVMGRQIAAIFFLLGYHVCLVSRSGFDEKIMMRQIKILKKHFDFENIEEGNLKYCNDINDIYDACTIEVIS